MRTTNLTCNKPGQKAGLLAFSLGAAVVLFASVGAKATVIDFEGQPDMTVITTQYVGSDVLFSGATILMAGGSLSPAYPPNSGVNVVYDDPSGGGIIQANSVSQPWSSVSAYVTDNTVISMTAFAADNSTLGSVSTPGANYLGSGGPPPNFLLSLAFPNIDHVTIHDTGNSFTVDDFSFTPVPEPATAALLALGGLILTGVRGRARRNPRISD